MMTCKNTGFWVAFGLSLLGTASFASEAPSPASSTTSAASESILKNLYINYFGTFHGPSTKDLSSPYTVDRTGKTGKYGINFDSELTTAYMIDPSIGIGPVVPFIVTPVLGQGFLLGDVGVKAFDKKTISTSNFNLYTNLILQAPTSDSSKARDMTLSIKTTPNARYNFSGTRVAIGAWTEAKAYLGVTKEKTFKLYAAPYANYRLTSNLSLNLEYEMEWHHDVGQPGLVGFAAYQTDLQPGFVWNITPHVMVNPYVQIFTTNAMSTERMALAAIISASVL